MKRNTYLGILGILCALCTFTLSTSMGQKGKSIKKNKMNKEIYLAGGCFWGTEHFLKFINGVESTQVGYANGNIANPTYQQVCTGTTNFAETVKVQYDPQKVALKQILELYFKTIDPTILNQQGHDVGTQYRTGIYYTDKSDLAIIHSIIEDIAKKYTKPLVVEVKELENFYKAEEYHQDYLDKNPGGYCHLDPTLFELAKKANSSANTDKK